MKKIWIAFSLALFILACGSGNSAPTPEEVALGKDLFKKKNCETCHGADGQQELNGAKNFKMSALNLDERITVIAKGKGLMAPHESILTPEEIRAVAIYTMELGRK